MKTLKSILIITLPTLVLLFIILELFFKFIIPASDPPLTVYNQEEQFTNYSNKRREGQYTIGKFAQLRTKWTINNDGWNYPIDYTEDREGIPLIAVIGDSYIDADMVSSDKNYTFLLREKFYPEKEVYAFGLSGIPLSQYYQLNQYVNRKFNPEIIIINLIYNDFDESFRKFDPCNNSWQIIETDSTFSLVPPNKANISPTSRTLKRLLYKSTFFRYLHRNLMVSQIFKHTDKDEVESNVKIVDDAGKRSEIIRGIDFLFKKIKQENEYRRVIFVLDAPRESIYKKTLETCQVIWLHEMVRDLSAKYEFELIDLTEPMKQDYAKNKRKFNLNLDGHWDEYGHQFVANTVYEYLKNNNQ
jgi:hypothetical protein